MRNKPFSYWLSGSLLLAGLAVVLPSGAEEIQGECYNGIGSYCVGTSKNVDVTFKASFTTPACNVTVPSEITLPDVTIAEFAIGGGLNGLGAEDGTSAADLRTNFDVTISLCDAVVQAGSSGWKYLRLTFTDLGNTSREAGIFAADYPTRDDVGFVIFADYYGWNVLTHSIRVRSPDTSGTDLIYHFSTRLQKYTDYTGTVAPGPVSGSVSVVADYE